MTYLPEKGHLPYLAPFGAKPELGVATLRQMEKDFALQGVELSLPNALPPYAELLNGLADFLRKHDILHGPSLAGLLYQLDINEGNMRQKIADTPPGQMYHMVAHEMLARCFAKVLFRSQYSGNP